MATRQNLKRPPAAGFPSEERPNKKVRGSEDADNFTQPSNFSPQFWDDLSRVWLTPRALRELDRRNDAAAQPAANPPAALLAVRAKSLDQFARHGGPNLCHLRGYWQVPKDDDDNDDDDDAAAVEMFAKRRLAGLQKEAEAAPPETKKASPYDDNFEQHLKDYGIYPEGHRGPAGGGDRCWPLEPRNMEELRSQLSARRPSLSPSSSPSLERAFEEFRRRNHDAVSEASVVANLIPAITGSASRIPNEFSLKFTNLASMTSERTVAPQPDYYEGARLDDVDSSVSRDLSDTIVPTEHARAPAVPNLFVEVKGPKGRLDVLSRQVCHDGAYGVRAMNSLQNYCRDEDHQDEDEDRDQNPEAAAKLYDGNAYVYSAAYHSRDQNLVLYAHHPTAPRPAVRGDGDQPAPAEYHMNEIGTYLMKNLRGFIEGVTALRNARDAARRYRDDFIEAANARARARARRRRRHGGGGPGSAVMIRAARAQVLRQSNAETAPRGRDEEEEETVPGPLGSGSSWTALVGGVLGVVVFGVYRHHSTTTAAAASGLD